MVKIQKNGVKKAKKAPASEQGTAVAELAVKAATPTPINQPVQRVVAVVKPQPPKKNFGISNLGKKK